MPIFTEFGVSNAAGLNNAIVQINAANSGTFEIDFLNDITLNAQLAAIVSNPGVSITINGSGHTLSGNDAFRGLFVYSGAATIENLEISHAVARGGNGTNGGGGGAGLGGGLFVADDVAHGAASPGNVTLVNVGFDNDQAIGGNGGPSNIINDPIFNLSGHMFVDAGGGGGGIGGSATPGTAKDFFGETLGQGGAGIGPNGFGVGGTVGGVAAGFGGGGYGVTLSTAGNGGYGGGGGGGDPLVDPDVGALDAHGGFGAGDGTDPGGGGLGAGGDIFVQQGAGLTIVGGTMAEGQVVGGLGGEDGSSFGSAIFMQGNGAIHLGTGSVAGQITTINGQIGDEDGSFGLGAGQGTVFIEGAGTVVLSNPSFFFGSYAGAAVLTNQATSGTLDTATSGAVGGGVLFEGPATLRIESEVFQDGDNSTRGHFAPAIIGFGYADVIDLPGLAFAGSAQAQYTANTHTLVVSSGGSSLTLNDVFGPVLPSFSAISDGTGGTKVVEALNAVTPNATTAAMVMRNSHTGQYEVYDIGSNAIVGAAALGYAESPSQQAQWQLAGLGSFNSADTADMIIRNTTTGAFELYDVNNNNFTSGFSVGQVGPEWSVLGFGAFSSRAGETDMLTRNVHTGQFEIYDIRNSAITSAASMGQVGLEWSLAGFGDFSTRPNETDMLMRNNNTGQFEIYDVSNNAITSAAPMGQIGLEWSIAGVGDFSGWANESDLLMRNVNTGQFEIYDISNNAITSAAPMGQIGLEWSVVGFGDFSGNANESDLLMRNVNTGQLEVYDISGNQLTSAAAMGQVGLEWQSAGIASNPTGGLAAADTQLTQTMASFAPSGGGTAIGQMIVPSAAPSLTAETTALTASNKPEPIVGD